MVTPTIAAAVIVAFIIVFGIGIPALEQIPKLKGAISYRWAVMVTLMAVMLGCVLDFSHINDQTRLYVLVGITIICALFILLRSAEKVLANGWHLGIDRVTISKGDLKGELILDDTKEGSNGSSKDPS
jgi:hypothetical protein